MNALLALWPWAVAVIGLAALIAVCGDGPDDEDMFP